MRTLSEDEARTLESVERDDDYVEDVDVADQLTTRGYLSVETWEEVELEPDGLHEIVWIGESVYLTSLGRLALRCYRASQTGGL